MQDLHFAINKYYTANDRHTTDPAGYDAIRKLVEEKIEVDCNNAGSDCNRLYQELKLANPTYNVVNANHYLFPNYVIIIELASSVSAHEKKHTWLYVVVSLLCDHYIIYLDTQYTYTSYNLDEPTFVNFNIVSLEQKFADCEYPALESIQRVVAGIFPKKTFVSHYYLSLQKLSGVTPFGVKQVDTGTFSMFDLLFSNHVCAYENYKFIP